MDTRSNHGDRAEGAHPADASIEQRLRKEDDLSVSSSSAPASARTERADASAIARLLEVCTRCARPDNDVSECLDAILEAAIAMSGADKGNLQVFDRESGTLAIAAQRGFEEPFLKFFANVGSGHATACGAAMSAIERIIVEDVTESDIFRGDPALDVMLSAGVRAVQSTPLVSSRGEVVGMISTHFTQPHRPDQRQLGFIDLLARQAADLIERHHAENALSEEFRNTQILHDLSTRLVTAENVQTIYEEVLSAAIAITRAKAGTVQMLDGEREELVVLATRGFSRRTEEYFHRVDARSHTSCGLALRTGTRSYFNFEPASTDVSARLHVGDGVLSAQSSPLVSRSGKAIGMVSTHWDKPDHRPSERELRFLDLLARQAADLIEQRAGQAALRDSEERLRRLNEQLEERVRERTSEARSLFEQLVSAQEEERRRIARDIHDQLGQQMTALRMNLDAWRAKANGDAAVHEQADRTQRLAEELDQSIDFLTWQLRPAALDHLGLSAALRHLVAGWSERFGIAAEYDASGDDGVRLSPDVEANLYRIVQEALHNVAKHAQATHVSVSLGCGAHEMVVVIEDDGRGFLPPPGFGEEGHGLGLVNMRERAALAGGRLDIESTPGTGSAVFVRVPIAVQESA